MRLPNYYIVVDIIKMAFESAHHGYLVVCLLNKKCKNQYIEYYLNTCLTKIEIERNFLYDSFNFIRFQNETHRRLTKINYIGTLKDFGPKK